MSRAELIDRLAQAIAHVEGYYVRGQKPTLAQRNANPGNIRQWRDVKKRPYPTRSGYVDFVEWARRQYPRATEDEIRRHAEAEGWRVLRVLIGQYVNGRYTGGRPPTIEEMCRVYAPASDRNDPAAYARAVAARLGVAPNQRLIDLITA